MLTFLRAEMAATVRISEVDSDRISRIVVISLVWATSLNIFVARSETCSIVGAFCCFTIAAVVVGLILSSSKLLTLNKKTMEI